MGEPSAAIVQILAEAYRSIAGKRSPAGGEPLLVEVTRIIRIYAEGMKVRPVEVISTGRCGMVLTEETATIAGAPKTWRGVHRWCFESGRCTKFEVYGQTLVVLPPAGPITSSHN